MPARLALVIAAWVVFGIDVAGMACLAINGWWESDPLGRSIALGVAELMMAPLLLLFAVITVSTWKRSRTGLWICLVLGSAPIILGLSNMARHSG